MTASVQYTHTYIISDDEAQDTLHLYKISDNLVRKYGAKNMTNQETRMSYVFNVTLKLSEIVKSTSQ